MTIINWLVPSNNVLSSCPTMRVDRPIFVIFQMEDLVPALERFKDFHLKFIAKYK